MSEEYKTTTAQKVNRMRNGEVIECNLCKIGIIRPVGNKETTTVFECDKCGKSIRLN